MARFINSHLSYLLGQANHALYRELSSHLSAAGLISLEWRILATLHDSPEPVPAMQLAREVLEKPSTVSKALKRMTERELVRMRADKGDARKACVETTAAGTRLAKRLCAEAEATQTIALQGLTAREQKELITLLHKLRSHAPKK
jgi:DNA-binding MarR family transcriptional regulator